MTQYFNDNGEVEPTCEPDWEAIDEGCGFKKIEGGVAGRDSEYRDANPQEAEYAFKMTTHILNWICRDGSIRGSSAVEGIAIRSCVVLWITLPFYRDYTLTDMAKKFGFQKQNLGRWVDIAKVELPQLKSPHYRTF